MGGSNKYQELHFQEHKSIISMQTSTNSIHSFTTPSAAVLTHDHRVTVLSKFAVYIENHVKVFHS